MLLALAIYSTAILALNSMVMVCKVKGPADGIATIVALLLTTVPMTVAVWILYANASK